VLKVNEVAEELKVSKVTIYNKIKSLNKELKSHLHKVKGVTYVDEKGFNLIKKDIEGLNSFTEFNESKEETTKNHDVKAFKEDLIHLQKDYIEQLKEQLKEKDRQLESKDELIKNFQVLLKNNKEQLLQLEEKIESRRTKSIWDKIFSK